MYGRQVGGMELIQEEIEAGTSNVKFTWTPS